MSTREELTRLAEKFLRQGRVEDAIAHYQFAADVPPVDWGVVRQLADLLERAGQREGAAAQFCRWADHLFAEGFHPKAAALYKKVLKLEPAHEHALWQLAAVSLALELKADARVALHRVIEARQRRHDAAGVATARARLEAIDGMPAASPVGGLTSVVPLVRPVRVDRTDDVHEPPARPSEPDAPSVPVSAQAAPVSEPVTAQCAEMASVGSGVEQTSSSFSDCHSSPVDSRVLRVDAEPEPIPEPAVATAPEPLGADNQGADVWFAEPESIAAGTDLELAPLLAPPAEDAIPVVTALGGTIRADETNGSIASVSLEAWLGEASVVVLDPPPPAPAARSEFDWADLLGREVAASSPLPRNGVALAIAGRAVGERDPDGSSTVHLDTSLSSDSTDASGARAQPSAVTAADVVAAAPPDVAVAGSADVVTSARPPGPALRMLGELQPRTDDEPPALPPMLSVSASWLETDPAVPISGESRDRHPEDAYLFQDDAEPALFVSRGRPVPPPPLPIASSALASTSAVPGDEARDADSKASEPSPEFAEPVAADQDAPAAAEESVDEEVDLTQLLDDLRQWDTVLPDPPSGTETPAETAHSLPGEELAPDPLVALAPVAPDVADMLTATTPDEDQSLAAAAVLHEASVAVPGEGSVDFDAVFADLQRQTDTRLLAEQQLAAGRVFLAAGLLSEAARAFERASLEPRSRFAAAQALAELHRSRGQLVEAVGWYEQASMAPVPDAAPKRAVLYDLAESLEALGETDRALGVLLDLLSQVEDYRDARARLDRLLRVDTGG